MVPVELQLTNFLSYGAAAPPLDFESFHVACLSGRNGQGKSALLDAMTWALWGEARKSAGSRKPDDELLHTGARQMQVEFVFDVEGDRFRVVRYYARSASGKTPRSGLEVNIYERETGEYRSLTRTSLRETQQHLESIIGLDYETFISSAFILQGRSDEFTKKKPNERKDILGRILNLGRYDRLSDMAREKERAWADRLQQLDAEIERLQASLEEEPQWKEARQELQKAAHARQTRIGELRAEERKITERLAMLDARAREAETGRRTMESLNGRMEQSEQDAASLRSRIQDAEVLTAEREQIERDYDQYEALQREREELDTKSHQFRGLEKQVERREADLRERRLEWEKKLHTVEVELRSNRTTLHECTAQLAEEPAARRCLKKAREALTELEHLNKVLQQRKAVEDEIAVLEKELLGMRESLAGRLKALTEQNEREKAALPALDQLQEQQVTLSRAVAERDRIQAEREDTTERGQRLAEAVRGQQGELAAQQNALRKQQDNFGRFKTAEDGICPTCGTHLNLERRDEVDAHFRETIAALQEDIGRLQADIGAGQKEREHLRMAYQTLQQKLGQFAKASDELSTLEERIRCYHEDKARIDARCKEIQALAQTVEEKRYGLPQRQRRRELHQALDGLPFDDERFEAVRLEAAQGPRYEDQLKNLEHVAGRKEQLERAVRQGEQQAETLRSQLEDGTVLGPVQEQIRRLQEQIDGIGFDPDRLERVRQSLRDLANAGARVKDLMHAQRNLTDWRRQLERVGERLEEARTEMAALDERLQRIGSELEGRGAIEAEREQLAHELKLEEDAFNLLQVQLGEVNASLERAARDREGLKARKAELGEARHQRQIFKHLRAAFGRHGIPSLIIEQTLPDLEDRANGLLDRLTEGRMHVKLETLRDKKTGGTKETLDLIIADEHGVARPYETFSGGEAFRVNFALRIALSQLLAERSGVRIRTLFVDEGFGTQDAQGLENLIEAIQVIQVDFEKIVVITHLEELKEAFPVRIEVTKDPVEGSTFEVYGV